MTSPRLELVAAWTGLLEGSVTIDEARSLIDTRLADYGPEEIVHSGLLALNETVRRLASGEGSLQRERERFETWSAGLAQFDADPAAWNRQWALDYAGRTLGSISPRAGRRMLESLSDKLTADDAVTLAARFGLDD